MPPCGEVSLCRISRSEQEKSKSNVDRLHEITGASNDMLARDNALLDWMKLNSEAFEVVGDVSGVWFVPNKRYYCTTIRD